MITRKKDDVINFVIISQSDKLREILKNTLLEDTHYRIIENENFSGSPEIFLQNTRADFVIISCNINGLADITLIKNLKQRYPELLILAIAEDNALKYIHTLCNAGADGFLIKEELFKLHEAVKTILSGRRFVNEILLNCLLQNALANSSDTYDEHFAIFNLKEHQVFQLADAGYSEEIIAKTLDISLEKVLLYKNRLYNKMQTIEHNSK